MRFLAPLLACTIALLAQDTPPRPSTSIASYMLGEEFKKQGNFQSAANEFRNALNGDGLPSWVVVWSRIQLGRIFEQTGQRERAVNEYRLAVQTNDNTKGALDEARKFLKDTGNAVPEVAPSPTLTLPPNVFPIGPGITPPVPIETAEPEYSDEGKLAELEGTAWIAAVVAIDGSVPSAQILRPIGLGLDEKAMEAVRKWRFRPGMYEGNQVATLITMPVDFVLPSKQSRWHLLRATFRTPVGASRPVFRTASYPPGAGVARTHMDHARVVAAVGRQATATVSFEIDTQGRPVQFKVEGASEDRWGPEAIAIVRTWEFTPGMKDGEPVAVPCTFTLAWGQRKFEAQVVRQIAERTR